MENLGALRSLFPRTWIVPLNPLKYDQVIIFNWLDIQITANPSKEVQALSGWRNREVYDWVKQDKLWVDRVSYKMYGGMPQI